MSTKDHAAKFRKLADAMEKADSKMKSWYSSDTDKEPYVSIDMANEAAATALKDALGIDSPASYDSTCREMRFELGAIGLNGSIAYPALTIPRACEYCDQKHDCTHIDGEVA